MISFTTIPFYFRPVKYFGGIDGFKKRNSNDVTKNIYAQKNKIPLLRISYLDKDISVIINDFIRSHSISMTYNLDQLNIGKIGQ